MNLLETMLISLVAIYNIILFIYSIKKGCETFPKRTSYVVPYVHIKPAKYSLVFDNTNHTYSLYDGNKWLIEADIDALSGIIKKNKLAIIKKNIEKKLIKSLCGLLEKHRKEKKLTCPDTCWCWDLEAIIIKNEEEESKDVYNTYR